MLTQDIADAIPADEGVGINTINRERAVDNLMSMPGDLDDNVTYIFKCFPQECADYVSSRGEVPYKRNIVKLAAQVCLLRAQDIAMKAKAFGCSQYDALKMLESEESAALGICAPDAYACLPNPLQGAIIIALQEASKGTGGSIAAMIEKLKGGNTSNTNGFDDYGSYTTRALMGNYADGDSGDSGSDWMPTTIGNVGLADTGGAGSSTITVAGNVDTSALVPSSGTTAGGSGGGILDFLGTLVNGAQQVAGAVSSISNSTNSTVTGINKIFGNIGGQSIASYLQNNKGTVLMAAIGIILVILLIVYLAKNRN